LYSLTGQHTAAINEYLALLSDNERRLGFVRSRLSTFIQQDDALSASIEGVETAVRTNPMNLAYRELLAWLHMEAEDYRAAFDVYRAIDRLQQESGRRLLGFARQAADAEAYGVALDAYDELLSRYPDAPVTPEARHSLGDMHRRWAETTGERVFDDRGNRITAPHYEAAVDAYRTYLQEYPDREAYPVVLRKLGRLQQDVFLRLNEAESALREVVNRYPESEAADEARYDLGRLALMRNNLDDARLTFSRLVERLRTGDLAEQARYELALLQFYEGSFETAMARIRSTNTNTSTDVANDAIELKVLILQNKGPDSLNTPLRHFAEARLEHRQRRFNQALATLDTLLTVYGQHALNDEARFLRASVLRDQGRADSAEVAFAELSMLFPQSPLADRSLFEAARLQEEALGDPASALKTYTKILEQYPSSLLAARARERIRALQANTSS
jgi:TolA-binding protein